MLVHQQQFAIPHQGMGAFNLDGSGFFGTGVFGNEVSPFDLSTWTLAEWLTAGFMAYVAYAVLFTTKEKTTRVVGKVKRVRKAIKA